MPWFWRSRKDVTDAEEEDSDGDGSYESYTDDDEEGETVEEIREAGRDAPPPPPIATTVKKSQSDSKNDDDDDDGGIMIRTDELAQLKAAAAAAAAAEAPPVPKQQQNEAAAAAAVLRFEKETNDRTINTSNGDDDDNHGDDDVDDDDDDELLSSGAIPSVVGGGPAGWSNRERLPSAISVEDEDGNDEAGEAATDDDARIKATAAKGQEEFHEQGRRSSKGGEIEQEEEEEEEEATSMRDKQSLLVLAAEHDRVDILQAILSPGAAADDAAAAGERALLLNPVLTTTVVVATDAAVAEPPAATSLSSVRVVTTVPPLHIAVRYGSVNAVNCLLRMGADPSLRPDVAVIQALQNGNAGEEGTLLEIPHMHRFDGMTAWELAFAKAATAAAPRSSSSGWSLFGTGNNGGSGGGLDDASQRSTGSGSGGALVTKRTPTAVDMAPSKREGIRHAFTAEALRCIGSDEVDRLQQLLASGMPASTEIGGKTLADWCVDMGAVNCQAVLKESGADDATAADGATDGAAQETAPKKSAVLDRGGGSFETLSIPALANRLDELEALSKALSTCLDNLAEEVSVCAGLILVGSGAQALASHVRSLKAKKERKYDELERMEEAWENSEDELAYWVKQCPGNADDVLQEVSRISSSHRPNASTTTQQTSGSPTKEAADLDDDEASQQQRRQQLKAQISASENKIRMLRAAIADLSEENVRNLDAVERRGLSGGITLVRGLRDEIREIEFQLSEAKSEEAACRAKIRLIQIKVKQQAGRKNGASATDEIIKSKHQTSSANGSGENGRSSAEAEPQGDATAADVDDDSDSALEEMPDSERIARGQSTAIVVRGNNGARGFLSFSIWHILLRIIGMGDDGRRGRSDTSPVMIV